MSAVGTPQNQATLIHELEKVQTALSSDRSSSGNLLDSARKHASQWIVDEGLRADVDTALDGWQTSEGI